MTDLNAMIAPQALTLNEITEVCLPHLASYGVLHRAVTFASGWDAEDAAIVSGFEVALAAVAEEAERSLKSWLADMETDNEPRFYRKAGLTGVISALCSAAAWMFAAQSGEEGVKVLITQFEERDPMTIGRLIGRAQHNG